MSKQIANKQPSPAELISKTEADIGRLEREREAHVERGAELSGARLDTKLLGVLFCGAAPQENAPPMGRGKGGFRHWVGPSEGDHPTRCIVLVGACALFPDFNPLRNAPATADKSNVLVSA